MPAGEELQAVLSKHVTRDSLHRFQWLLWKHKKWFEENLGAYSSRLCSATIHGLQDYCIASPGRTGIFQSTHPLTFPSPASQGKGYETICFCSKITKANTSWDCCSTKCVSTMMDSRDGSMMNILSRSNLKTLGNNYVLTFYKHRCHDLRNELLSVGLGTGELLQKSWLLAGGLQRVMFRTVFIVGQFNVLSPNSWETNPACVASPVQFSTQSFTLAFGFARAKCIQLFRVGHGLHGVHSPKDTNPISQGNACDKIPGTVHWWNSRGVSLNLLPDLIRQHFDLGFRRKLNQ